MDMIRHDLQRHDFAIHLLRFARQHLSQVLTDKSGQHFSPSLGTQDKVKINQRNAGICMSIACTHDRMVSIMDRVLQGRKYRFYPTKSQQVQLAKEFGCARYVYNWGLVLRQTAWRNEKLSVNYVQCSKALAKLKEQPETVWLKEVSSVTLQQSLRHLDAAFVRLFKKQTRYPVLKKRKGPQSVSYPLTGFRYKSGCLSVSKLGKLKIRWSRCFTGKPTSIVISKNAAGQYYVSFHVDEALPVLLETQKIIGIDLGIKTYAVTSDGEEIQAPKPLKKYRTKLRKAHKAVSTLR